MNTNENEFQLSFLADNDRLNAYEQIVSGCTHLWSKGKLQKDRLNHVLDLFMKLADKDPVFLAHFASYAIKKLDSKDLKVVSVFANSLSDADGTPFIVSKGPEGIVYSTKYKKPNLRIVSQAALQDFDPKLVSRVIELANIKQSLGERYREGTHFTRTLKTAVRKWIRFREQNPKAIEGIKKAGFSKMVKGLYRALHLSPSTEAAEILRWKQKDGREMTIKAALSFEGLNDLEIAEKIRADKIKPMSALGALPEKISPVIAVAILEQASGNQAVILRALFDRQGLLKEKEVMDLFNEKLKTAGTALDRVDRINTEIDREVEKTLKKAKAEKRKEQVGDVGKIFMHIDISGSMQRAVEFAKERGAVIAECVANPEENFFWGLFNRFGTILERPESFEKDGFMAKLYGVKAGGSTECLANYLSARKAGCDIDVYVTDQGHNGKPVEQHVQECDRQGLGRPKAVVIVDFSGSGLNGHLAHEFLKLGIPVSILKPETLTESALVTQAVQSALKGAIAVIDEIMATKLIRLPSWWDAVK